MAPILARYGTFFLYSYTVVLSLGLLAAGTLVAREARRTNRPGWQDAALLILIAGVAGGRLGYVLVHLEYFRLHPQESWRWWLGGQSYHGVLWGALVALAWWSSRRPGRSFALYGDLFAPPAMLLGAAGWLACLLEGSAYGRETLPGPFVADLPDAFGVYAFRYPTQAWGFLASVALFLVIYRLRGRLRPGQLLWLALLLFSLLHALVGLFRGDPVPMPAGVRLDVILDLVTAAGAILGLVYGHRPVMRQTAKQQGEHES